MDDFIESKVVIDWAQEKSSSGPPMIINWKNRIRFLIGRFRGLTFYHINEEHNGVVDTLSKVGHRYLLEDILYYFNDNLKRNRKIMYT